MELQGQMRQCINFIPWQTSHWMNALPSLNFLIFAQQEKSRERPLPFLERSCLKIKSQVKWFVLAAFATLIWPLPKCCDYES